MQTVAMSPAAVEALTRMGQMLIQMQVLEKLVSLSLTFPLRDVGVKTLDALFAAEAKNKKATIGRLIVALKSRVDLDDDFATMLDRFLDYRNTFVHDLDRMGGFDWQSDSGIARMHDFLDTLASDTEFISKAFTSLLVEWTSANGVHPEGTQSVRDILGDLDGIATSIFFPKPVKGTP
ncbi:MULTISPECIES: hypothetical protein [unclassified Shinella]|uniref:hypothetical protein n=1 Tax=unclassified Shinella TaxID=2643062 RepID=UPI00234EBD72|nr:MULTISPECIES: hypothetical protein [unclassified Shinella]MCO5152573.1 hypothetical protein [Shinella sp.]MDC7261868.1 hypothetical protein [Shinella sp. HY16]MDC7268763.1 hypothetical protein [Shinella sp. YZ44]